MGTRERMSRREALSRMALAGTGAAALGSLPLLSGCSSRRRGRPNILFIFSDDHATQAIGAYGSRINRTPNIDRIAAGGAVFENSFCTNGICAPSRAVVLTGKHSHLNGKIDNRDPFDMDQPTFNKTLQASEYQTAVIGKWHLREDPQGFDHWEVLPGQGAYYNPDFRTPSGQHRREGYVTDLITDLSLDWLREGRDPDRPFLLMCQHKAPHRNWMPGPDHLDDYEGVEIPEPPTLFDDYEGRAEPASEQEMTIARHMMPGYDLKILPEDADEAPFEGAARNIFGRMTPEQRERWQAVYGPRNRAYREMELTDRERTRYFYQRYIKDYLRCVDSVDEGVGRILDYLAESGLEQDTLVIYSSDQGFFLGEHGWYDKRWMYEESLRMPFIARWPGVIPAGQRVPQMIQNLDYAPTFLDAAGLEVPAEMQGRSLMPLLEGRRPGDWRESIYYHYYEFPAVHMVARHYGVRTRRYKLIHYYQTDEWELFDLVDDPMELESVYGRPAYAEVQAELEQELLRLREHYGDTTGEPPAVGERPAIHG